MLWPVRLLSGKIGRKKKRGAFSEILPTHLLAARHTLWWPTWRPFSSVVSHLPSARDGIFFFLKKRFPTDYSAMAATAAAGRPATWPFGNQQWWLNWGADHARPPTLSHADCLMQFILSRPTPSCPSRLSKSSQRLQQSFNGSRRLCKCCLRIKSWVLSVECYPVLNVDCSVILWYESEKMVVFIKSSDRTTWFDGRIPIKWKLLFVFIDTQLGYPLLFNPLRYNNDNKKRWRNRWCAKGKTNALILDQKTKKKSVNFTSYSYV